MYHQPETCAQVCQSGAVCDRLFQFRIGGVGNGQYRFARIAVATGGDNHVYLMLAVDRVMHYGIINEGEKRQHRQFHGRGRRLHPDVKRQFIGKTDFEQIAERIEKIQFFVQRYEPFLVALQNEAEYVRELVHKFQCPLFVVASDKIRQTVERIKEEMRIDLVSQRVATTLQHFPLQPLNLQLLLTLYRIQSPRVTDKHTQYTGHDKLKQQVNGEAINMLID